MAPLIVVERSSHAAPSHAINSLIINTLSAATDLVATFIYALPLMKRPSPLAWLALLPLWLLWGCPTGADYPLGTLDTEAIDPALLGTWAQDDTEREVMRVVVRQKTETAYAVEVLERGATFALEDDLLTGWVTTIGDKKFIYLKPASEEKYYLYCYEVRDGELLTWDVGLLVGGIDAVTSTEAYRQEVAASLGLEDCLSSQTHWLPAD